MEPSKQTIRFLARKQVKAILENKELGEYHISRLNSLFEIYRVKQLEDMHKTIALFVLYDLNNYLGRLRRLRGVPGTSKYTQLLRYGKENFLSVLKSQNESKSRHFKNTVSYWERNGYSTSEAKQLVSLIQAERSSRSPSTQKGAVEYSIRRVEYWIKKGMSPEDAKLAVSNAQRRRHSKERNVRWQNTLKSKPANEIDLINRKKSHSVDGYLLRGHSIDEAERLSRQYWQKRKNYSRSSQAFFMLLGSLLGEDEIYYKTLNYEKQLSGKLVDFFHAASGTVVEYYGDFWHRNPTIYSGDFLCYKQTSKQVWERDEKRLDLIKKHSSVKRILVVWESEVLRNPQQAADRIYKEIRYGKC
jgi:hypothetical protein